MLEAATIETRRSTNGDVGNGGLPGIAGQIAGPQVSSAAVQSVWNHTIVFTPVLIEGMI